MAIGAFGSGLGRSSAVIDVDSRGIYRVRVGVTDIGTAAKATMGLIAAEALDVPLDQIEVISGDTAQCPYSVGESGSRTTTHTGYAVSEAARDLKGKLAEKATAIGSGPHRQCDARPAAAPACRSLLFRRALC